jgi:hypothetical protein
VAVRLPPFWAERPAVWFAQAEAQFSLAGISSERTKFYYVISQLDQRYAAEVEDFTSPPQQNPYSKLRTELLKRLSLSREKCAHRFSGSTRWAITSRRSSSGTSEASSQTCRTTFCERSGPVGFPRKCRPLLPACHPEVDLDAAVDCADRIIETVPSPALASIGQPTDNNEILRRIEELSRWVAVLSAERDSRSSSRDRPSSFRDPNSSRRDRPSSPRNRRPYNRSPSRHDTSTTCWYH